MKPSSIFRTPVLEVIVDFEHAMDANCGRRENGEKCDADFSKHSWTTFTGLTAQCVGQQVSRIVVCDTTGGASPEEVTQVIGELTKTYPGAKIRISWSYRSRTWHRQFARSDSSGGGAGSRHAAGHGGALRQREPDHGNRQHAIAGRG